MPNVTKKMGDLKEKVMTIKGSKEVAKELDLLNDSECRHLLAYVLNHKEITNPYTPPAEWQMIGASDPHGEMYNKERANIACGGLTDDQMANALFMGGDSSIPFMSGIALLTAGKERIRWMSRSMTTLLKLVLILRSRLAKYENVEVIAPTKDLDKFVDTEYSKYVRAIIGK